MTPATRRGRPKGSKEGGQYAITLRGWRWLTSRGRRIPCARHTIPACETCMKVQPKSAPPSTE